ncbi:MAG: ATP-binding protein [Acidobacteria bacterium]|nr:ATP-binding protein [Acidobacteriota bacterium]
MQVERNHPSCPDCNDTGWRLDAVTSAVRRCDCTLEKDVGARLRYARIPVRYQHCSLENYHPQHDSQFAAKGFAEKFVDQFPQVDGGLLFVGSAGVGKTHLSVAILKALVERKAAHGLFYDFRDLLREIQHSWNPVSQSSEIEVLRPVLEIDVLVLDELGANKPTTWVQDTMTHIINSRYNEKKVTIFTSNFPDRESDGSSRGPDAALMRREESLTDRVGARLRSRLYEMCTLVEIVGEDFRKTVRQSSFRFK